MSIVIAEMGPPGGWRNVVTPRLQRNFNIMTYTDLQDESIHTIFFTIINAFMYNFTADIKNALDGLCQMTLRPVPYTPLTLPTILPVSTTSSLVSLNK